MEIRSDRTVRQGRAAELLAKLGHPVDREGKHGDQPIFDLMFILKEMPPKKRKELFARDGRFIEFLHDAGRHTDGR
jgi:hypothetical protein